ncbi:MAG TPA: hypothetical protein VNO18_01770 [Xanthobacteraceae bacterium]|nr:hypothetical protein [Xanthobacteraceae bacterium]
MTATETGTAGTHSSAAETGTAKVHPSAAATKVHAAAAKVTTTSTAEVTTAPSAEVTTTTTSSSATVTTASTAATAATGLRGKRRRNSQHRRQQDCANSNSAIFHGLPPGRHVNAAPLACEHVSCNARTPWRLSINPQTLPPESSDVTAGIEAH